MAPDRPLAVAAEEELAGGEGADAREERAPRRRAAEDEQVIDRAVIDLASDHPAREQALDLRAPEEPALGLGDVERADPRAVAGQDQGARARVPQRDGELPPRVLEHAPAVLLPEVRPQLDVAARPQLMPAGRERAPEILVIEQLAVAARDHVAGLVGDRLRAALEIDQREAARGHGDPRGQEEALTVGAAVLQRGGHPGDGVGRELSLILRTAPFSGFGAAARSEWLKMAVWSQLVALGLRVNALRYDLVILEKP